MKKFFRAVPLLLMMFILNGSLYGQGKFSGTYRNLIGISYADNFKFPGLQGWEFREGSIVSELSDPERFMVNMYQQGKSRIVFFTLMTDTVKRKQRILDVIYLKDAGEGYDLKTAFCRDKEVEDAFIVAWVKTTTTEFMKPVKKAWRFNRDKRRFEAMPGVKTIDCMNEGSGE